MGVERFNGKTWADYTTAASSCYRRYDMAHCRTSEPIGAGSQQRTKNPASTYHQQSRASTDGIRSRTGPLPCDPLRLGGSPEFSANLLNRYGSFGPRRDGGLGTSPTPVRTIVLTAAIDTPDIVRARRRGACGAMGKELSHPEPVAANMTSMAVAHEFNCRQRRHAVTLPVCTSRPQQMAYRISMASLLRASGGGGASPRVRRYQACCPSRGATVRGAHRTAQVRLLNGLTAPRVSRPSLPTRPGAPNWTGATAARVSASRS